MLLCDRMRAAFESGADRRGRRRDVRRLSALRRVAQPRAAGSSRALSAVENPAGDLAVPDCKRLDGRDSAVYSAVYHDFHAMQAMFPGLVPKPGLREQTSRRFSDFRDRLFADRSGRRIWNRFWYGRTRCRWRRRSRRACRMSILPLAQVVNRLPRDIRAPGGVTKPLLKRIAERFLDPNADLSPQDRACGCPTTTGSPTRKGLGRYLDLLTDPDGRLRAYAKPGAADRRRSNVSATASGMAFLRCGCWSMSRCGCAAFRHRATTRNACERGEPEPRRHARMIKAVAEADGPRLQHTIEPPATSIFAPNLWLAAIPQRGAVTALVQGLAARSRWRRACRRFARRDAVSTERSRSLLAQAMGIMRMVVSGPGWAFAAVDWVRCIPLAATRSCRALDRRRPARATAPQAPALVPATSIRMPRSPSAWRATPSIRLRSIAASNC